ncbi:gliding motility-associated ABC transporter substrate-binding protein GldG [Flavobacterium sp. MK4S-17]|uniref:gliding motility-associated ABC transporter substrate-binding protein GldG n=1 Tax=Flavobacterium sp. MK4S-17 TaxID=2543737 RepID=UPI001359F0A6|nr:gliding motility-associated ABC transporter substrate-binding protein GldG [Flavobacterium sp. MK4S-17]
MERIKKKSILKLVVVIFAIVFINILAHFLYIRFDLTTDKRYTLSLTTTELIEKVSEPLYIDVFLGGELPPEFRRLQKETRSLLEEYQLRNPNIIFNFNDPLEDETTAEQYMQELYALGFTPTNININKKGKKSIVQIFPWAIANIGQKSVKVPLLVNSYGHTAEANINKSVELLEYAFTDAIYKLTTTDKKKIAVLKGNGELEDKYMADFLRNLSAYYLLGEFNIDSLQNDRKKTLENLNRFDLAIVAKPTTTFTDDEKYVFDQYIMSGGKSIWMIDKVSIDLDSLRNKNQTSLAFPNNLNLDDMFFKYGIRINDRLIQDLFSTPITVQSPNGPAPVDWLYSPIVQSEENHPVNKNINLVKLEFANSIDTLANNIKKTILLRSSSESRTVGTPQEVSLGQFMDNLNPGEYTQGNIPIAVLLEGKFTSAFKNRVKPFELKNNIDEGKENKMIVIADGDIINYTYVNKKPLDGGIDPWTQQIYSNKDFLLNCVNYLMNDSSLINIRSKRIDLKFLDNVKVEENYTTVQLVTIGIPLLILLIAGLLFTYLRRRKYSR